MPKTLKPQILDPMRSWRASLRAVPVAQEHPILHLQFGSTAAFKSQAQSHALRPPHHRLAAGASRAGGPGFCSLHEGVSSIMAIIRRVPVGISRGSSCQLLGCVVRSFSMTTWTSGAVRASRTQATLPWCSGSVLHSRASDDKGCPSAYLVCIVGQVMMRASTKLSAAIPR